jgi:hypothetical protein
MAAAGEGVRAEVDVCNDAGAGALPRRVGARVGLGSTARGNSKVRASQKFDNPTKHPTIPSACLCFPRRTHHGSSSCKRRKRKCCVQGTEPPQRAWGQAANPGRRTRRSPELFAVPTSLLQEVRCSQTCILELHADEIPQPCPMRFELYVPLSWCGRWTPTNTLAVVGTQRHGQDGMKVPVTMIVSMLTSSRSKPAKARP